MAENTNIGDGGIFQLCNLIELEQVPRLHYNDPEVDLFLAQNLPVVITGSNTVKPALDKWTLDYLEENMGSAPQTVYSSPTTQFKYFDEKKAQSKTNPRGVPFTPPFQTTEMTFGDFAHHLKQWKPGHNRLYLQQSLNGNVGPLIADDFIGFNWNFVSGKQHKHSWGTLTSNLLLLAQDGNVTPCHYDEQQNLFAQIKGTKRITLFSPSQFNCLYPHPVHHPHDRQSMVDLENPNLERFPNFSKAKGLHTIIYPGDVLYIPVYWWHHVESLKNTGYTITVNFWFKAAQSVPSYPLKDHQKVAVMRNVEKMLLEVLQDSQEVGPLLKAMADVRFDEDQQDKVEN